MTYAKMRQKTRADIINAAKECFSNKPYEKVTMDEISEKSQYSKRTIYNYFPSKAAIMEEVSEYLTPKKRGF